MMDTYTIIMIFIIIGLVGLGIGIALIIIGSSKKEKVNKKSNNNSKKVSGNDSITAGYAYKDGKNKDIAKKDIFDFMEFDKIVDDMIVQEKKGKYIMVLQCKGINYDLMSEVEQLSVEEGFVTFLNTLKFPIQLYVQARAINLDKSLNIYKDSVKVLDTKYNDSVEKYNQAAKNVSLDASKLDNAQMQKEKFANMLDYAKDITRYVEKMSLNKHMLQRKFYVVYSYNKAEINSSSNFNAHEVQDICRRELFTRGQTLISALATCSVNAKMLNSNELAELLYVSYNRDDEKLIDIKTALDSGFYRLYSTSKDIMQKRDELMLKEIKSEAMNRVKSAIDETMEHQEKKSPEELIEEYEENVDREAVNIIRGSNINADAKKRLIENIAQKHVLGVEARQQARKVVQESIAQQQQKEITEKDENKENVSNDDQQKNKEENITNEENKNTVDNINENKEADKVDLKENNTASDENESII